MKTRVKRNNAILALLSGTALSLGLSGTAFAQNENSEETEEGASGERNIIVVTATRREESITDVPYNISAVSGDTIEAARTFDSAELLRSVPGVGVVDRGARSAGTINQIRIRGLSVDGNALGDYSVSSVASVSTYLNDTPIFANFLLRDLERVEVLRGPQGTLYGSGALGGTVRYITRNPELGEFGGSISGSLSNVDGTDQFGYSIDGILNIPIGDTLALRLVGSYGDYPGITDYVNVYDLDANGIPVAPSGVLSPDASYRVAENADTVEQWMTRATLLWEPSDSFNVKALYMHQDNDVGGRRAQTINSDGFGREYQRYENGSIQLEPSESNDDLAALEINVDMGFATLTSSSSYYDREGSNVSENTGFYAQAGFLGLYYNYPRPMASAVRSYRDEAFVQELRLVSNSGGPIDYIIGGFYRDQKTQSTQQSFLRGFKQWWDAAFPLFTASVTGDQDFNYIRDESFEELALFGEVTWHVTDTLDITGGVRYFDNSSENTTFIDLPLFAGVFTPTTAFFETKEDDVLFKGNVSWQFTPRERIYATISEGYRRGGTNAVPLTGTFAEDPGWQTYESDSVVNYEIGVKGTRSGIIYDVSLFYIDWDAPQLNTATTNWGFFAVQNGDSARTMGLEAQIDGYIGDRFHYNLGYTYTDAELTSDFFAPDNAVTPVALDGTRLPGAPKHMINWALDYTAPLSDNWSFFARLDGSYQSSSRNGVGVSPTFNVPLEGFSIWNTVFSVSNESFTGSLWMKNIFNEEGVTGVFTEAYMGTAPTQGYFGNGNKQLISLPRTIGASATFRF